MGNKHSKSSNSSSSKEPKVCVQSKVNLQKSNFEMVQIVGKGGFGKVWKVVHKKYKTLFALKEMNKAKIIDKQSESSVITERELLSQLRHPFIVNMYYAFQDNNNLYLIMDLLTGGDMRYHISSMNKYKKKFTEEQAKFFVACIVLALDYTHSNNILHRDLKPENFVFDNKGYLRLTDYGIARVYQKDNYTDTSGTPGYMAPEVLCCQNHTIAVDYFALGVFTFELMFGYRPYNGKSRSELKEKILSKQVQIKSTDIPKDWTVEAADFINRLLQRKPKNRLGLRGSIEIREHAWLKYYPWKDLYNKTLESPFKIVSSEPWDNNYVNNPDNLGIDTKIRYENIRMMDEYKTIFENYYFYYNPNDSKDINNSKLRILPCDHDKLKNGVDKYSSSLLGNNQKIEENFINDEKSIVIMNIKDRTNSNNSQLNISSYNISNIKNIRNITSNKNSSNDLKNNDTNKDVNDIKSVNSNMNRSIISNSNQNREGNSNNNLKVMTKIESKLNNIRSNNNSNNRFKVSPCFSPNFIFKGQDDNKEVVSNKSVISSSSIYEKITRSQSKSSFRRSTSVVERGK